MMENEVGKKSVLLTFGRASLLYDIRNAAYIEGHVMPSEAEHSRHVVTDIGEEGNVDRVTRVMDIAVSQSRELLYPFAKHAIEREVLDDRFKERNSYGILLQVPEDFSQTTLTLLERLIHEYIVCRVMADWLSITNPAKSEVWADKAMRCESEIRVRVHSRSVRTRIKGHWI